MTDQGLLLLAWTVPLLLSVFTFVQGAARRLVFLLAPWAAVPAVLLAWLAAPGVTVDVPWLMMGGTLALDGLAADVLRPLAVVWLAGGLFARSYAPTRDSRSFWSMFLLAMAGNVGLVLAADALELYLFFALMTFAGYVLVVHDGSPRARHAGKRYLQFAVAGEVLLFGGIALAVGASGDARFPAIQQALAGHDGGATGPVALAFLVAGFGVKAGLVPLHAWLPLAHPAAPTPASAILSGAMIKAGVIGWLRFLPLGQTALTEASLLIGLGIVGAFFGVLRGLRHTDPKTILAYSSVSQMGAVASMIGVGLTRPGAWSALAPAVLAYIAHHAVAKAALFLGIASTKRTAPEQPSWRCVMAWAPTALGALALAGAPLTSGLAVKAAVKTALPSEGAAGILQIALPIASVATAMLMGWYVSVLWRARTDGKPATRVQHGLSLALSISTLAPASSFLFGTPTGPADLSAIATVAAGAAAVWVLRRRLVNAPPLVVYTAERRERAEHETSALGLSERLAPTRAAVSKLATSMDRALGLVEQHLEQTRWIALLLVTVCLLLAVLALA